jgi:hypothetical protein
VGEVRTLTPFSLSDKVFAQTELPALLANDKITSIDGIARADLLRLVNDMGGIGNADALDAARSAIAAQSWLKALDLEIGTDSVTGKLLVGDSTFFNTNIGITGSELPTDATNRTSISDLMDSQWDALRKGADHLGRIDYLSALEKGVDKLGKLGTAADVLTLLLAARDANAAYEQGDTAGASTIMAEWAAKFAAGFAGGAELASLAAAFSAPWALTGPVGAGAATIFTVAAGITGALLGEAAAEFAIDMGRKYELILNEASLIMESLVNTGHTLSDFIASFFTAAQLFVRRSDPLTLDLDGDGSIDDGSELFGDSTPVLDAAGNVTGQAVDGFDALAQQDSNGDGVVNNSDANFADLRVWQDLNQDGISQANELKTSDEIGIAGINVGKTEHSKVLPGGNEIADLGTYTRTDGTTGGTGAASGLADVNLADDTFHHEFTDHLDISAAAVLPDMQGSGAVRDLREAASQSPELAATLAQLGANTTREQLKAAIGVILQQWADSANFNDSFETADAQRKTSSLYRPGSVFSTPTMPATPDF